LVAEIRTVNVMDALHGVRVLMSEGSHHENIWVAGRIVGTMRVTNSGKIISIWMSDPYNQLFFPDGQDDLS